jgi:pyridoxine/pyridoxamine 5'-phosphate oxidase
VEKMLYLDIAIASFGLSLIMILWKGLQDVVKIKGQIDKINTAQDSKLSLIEYKLDKLQAWSEQVTEMKFKN